MSYGNKYKIQLDSVFLGDTYLLYIQEEDYSGAVTNLVCGSDPIRVEWHNTSDDKFGQVIIGSTLEVYVLADSSVTQYDSLFTSNSRKYKGVLYKNASIIWQGYGMTDNYSRPDYCKPFELVITFTDGLGMLKDYEFNEAETYDWDTRLTLARIIGICLAETDLNLKVYESINIYEENMDSDVGDSMLAQTYIYPRAFRGLSCYEVLERILLGSQLKQRNGAWWIIRTYEKKALTIYYRYWDSVTDIKNGEAADGNSTEDLSITLTDVNQDAADLNVFKDRSQRIDWMGGWKKFTLETDSGFNPNLIKNAEQFTAIGSPHYVVTGDILYLTGTNHLFTGAHIRYNLGSIATAYYQRFEITLKGRLQGDFWFQLEIQSDSGEFYYLSDELNDKGHNMFSLSSVYFFHGSANGILTSESKNYALEEFSVTFKTVPLVDVYAVPGDTLTPFPATVYLRVYEPAKAMAGSSVTGKVYLDLKESKVELLSDTNDYNKNSESEVSLSITNNIIPDNLVLHLVDGYSIPNDNLIFDNIMYRYSEPTYYETKKWSRRGGTGLIRYSLLFSQELADQYTTEWRKRVGQLICNFDIDKVVYDDTYYYMIAGARFSPKFDLWDVTMLQISAAEEYILFEDEDIMELETGDYVKK